MTTIIRVGLLEHLLLRVQIRVQGRPLVPKKELSKGYREVFGVDLSFLVDLLLLRLARLPDYLHLIPLSHRAEVDNHPPLELFLNFLLINRKSTPIAFLKIHHHTITIPE